MVNGLLVPTIVALISGLLLLHHGRLVRWVLIFASDTLTYA